MRERKESGMSITAYCKNAGFHENIYYYWQRKLREAAYQELPETTRKLDSNQGNVGLAANRTCSPTPPGWVLCETASTPSKTETIQIEIGQCRINAAPEVNLELLAKVCRVLVAL